MQRGHGNGPRDAPMTWNTAVAAIFLFCLSTVIVSTGAQETPTLSARDVVEQAGGAVVMIEAKSDGQISQGSGFVAADDGTIVTSLHVVDGATELTVSFRNGMRLSEVAVRAFDVERDLVVLVVELASGDSMPAAVDFGETSSIAPGASIFVISNPLGLEHTVTQGIVSAWREPKEPERYDASEGRSTGPLLPRCRVLQISAAISPGSSGGPVFNDRAEVIGVATAGVLYGAAGLNFAVPVDELPTLLEADEAMDLATFRVHADGVRLDLARPHFDDAEIAYERGEITTASRHLERALQIFPRYEQALLLSGRIAMDVGQTELAEQRFGEALTINPDNPEAWYRFGEVHHRMGVTRDDAGLLSRAETEYRTALEMDPRHARAAFNLGVILSGRGLFDQAEELLVTAIENEPDLLDAHYMLGEIYLARGQIEDAKDAFNRALWEDESHARSHFGLARLYTLTDVTAQGTVSSHGRAPHHWEEFLRLSEDDPSLAEEREIAIRIVQRHYPELLDR